VLSAKSHRHVHLCLYNDVLHIIRTGASLPVHDAVYIGVFIDVAKFRLSEKEALFLETPREVVVALSSKTSVPVHQHTRSHIIDDLNLHESALKTTDLAS
jgi:hypothetical protein